MIDTGATWLFAVIFFLLIMVSVALHEVGHMVPARLFGVRVPEFFVGFGPRLWSTKRRGTEYGFKIFPLGGYVRLLGMYPPVNPAAKPSHLQTMADQARSYEWEQITEADVSGTRLFYQKRTWQKLTIMAGGPAMNLLIAFLLFTGIAIGYGNTRATTTVASIQNCVIRDDRANTQCLPTDEASPAFLAGVRAGDVVLEFNGVKVDRFEYLTSLIRANMDGEATLVVLRDGVRTALPTVHTVIEGVPDQLDPSRRIAAGWFGIRAASERVKEGPLEVIGDMWTMSLQGGIALVQFPVKTFNVVVDLIAGRDRDINGPLSILGASRLAGEVATTDASLEAKVVSFAGILGSVNLFLALFNFVPLPPLDGGHMAGAVYEWLRRQVARLRGRTDPGPFDTAKMLPVAYAVGAFLLVSGVALILADIISPIRIF